jgi:ATP-binding cassette, subfamily B, bacterial
VAVSKGDASPVSGEDELLSTPKRDLVSKAWRYLSDQRRTLAGLAALSVLAAQVESVALVLIAVIADGAARGSATAQLSAGPVQLNLAISTAAMLAALAIVVTAALVLINGYLSANTFARLERSSRDEIVATYAEADWEYQSTQKSSRVQGRLLRLMDARAVAFNGLVAWTRALVTIIVFVGVAAVMSPLAATVIVAFGVVLSLAVMPIRRRIVRLGAWSADEEVGLAGDLAEAADHGADVHVFGAWPAFLGRFEARSRSLETVRARIGVVKSLTPVVYQYGALALILSIMLLAVVLGAEGQIGQIAASALLLLRSVQYGQQLQYALQQIAESVPRIELLNRQTAVPPPRVVPGQQALTGIERLELRNVSYQYPGSVDDALSGISLDLRPGTIVGLAGPSGSGKSTLAQILLRVRWPTSGQYLVNGRSADVYSPASWTRLVSHVPQQPRLLHGSLVENVSFLDESTTRDQVATALKAVGLEELTDLLAGGLDAELGPTGRSLSGGQVQRLGIARALVREPRLVILDEPTSALDVNAERIVGDALAALRGRSDVLVVIIAHRPSTLAMCDEFLVLQDGRVAAAGKSDVIAGQSEFLARTFDVAPAGSGMREQRPSR